MKGYEIRLPHHLGRSANLSYIRQARKMKGYEIRLPHHLGRSANLSYIRQARKMKPSGLSSLQIDSTGSISVRKIPTLARGQ
jgi:hypothetical protein